MSLKWLGLALTFGLALEPGSAMAASPYFDRSHTIFFPKELSAQLKAQESFSAFWWNFIVIEPPPQRAHELCQALLASGSSELVSRMACGQDAAMLAQFQPLLSEWAADYPLRAPLPAGDPLSWLKGKMSSALTKASLPIGAPLVQLLRHDPLESYQELRERMSRKIPLDLPQTGGVFHDAKTGRAVIAVQFSYPPSDIQKTARFMEALEDAKRKVCDGTDCATLIGPHASTHDNQAQIMRDLKTVEKAGLALLALIVGAMLLSGRWKLIALIPPVLVSTTVAALGTILVFGSIHGLTLSFGTGIIGLAADYGLHRSFNSGERGIWRANLFGLLTTLIGLVVMMFSGVPLLRQLMVFASLGLCSGFAAYYVIDRLRPAWISNRPLNLDHRTSAPKFALIVGFLLSSVVGMALIRPNLDMKQFDVQDQRRWRLSLWLYGHLSNTAPLIQITTGGSPLERAHEQRSWAMESGIELTNAAEYLPSFETQRAHLATWHRLGCARAELAGLDPTEQRFFAPFLTQAICGPRTPRLLAEGERVPAYLQDLVARDASQRWLSLWLPKNDSQAAQVQARYPEARSLREIVAIFPRTLARELAWMTPLGILLAGALLALYYRRLTPTLLSLLPFFSGLGLFSAVTLLLGHGFSFISLIALVMVFGFSIDYGIFVTDLIEKDRPGPGVWTTIALSALTTLSGFLPLIFCSHPVLRDLGRALVFGTIGTHLGAIWGIPGIKRYLRIA